MFLCLSRDVFPSSLHICFPLSLSTCEVSSLGVCFPPSFPHVFPSSLHICFPLSFSTCEVSSLGVCFSPPFPDVFFFHSRHVFLLDMSFFFLDILFFLSTLSTCLSFSLDMCSFPSPDGCFSLSVSFFSSFSPSPDGCSSLSVSQRVFWIVTRWPSACVSLVCVFACVCVLWLRVLFPFFFRLSVSAIVFTCLFCLCLLDTAGGPGPVSERIVSFGQV